VKEFSFRQSKKVIAVGKQKGCSFEVEELIGRDFLVLVFPCGTGFARSKLLRIENAAEVKKLCAA